MIRKRWVVRCVSTLDGHIHYEERFWTRWSAHGTYLDGECARLLLRSNDIRYTMERLT
ncbi:hypothetical protein GS982_01785 [Rhodococcus hoagii]|uniref:Uncharacterized protein n=1 Tax=Rhodococcus hoagii TaxID=43767 RepID=A0A9Q4ZIT8_RHOHA|nr:hypothetical protein [Prescottella equi]NKT77331.1 hypothetical protein [Prescottella equi]NKZ81116.1 hypothetical protein [Prescottella equi]